MRLFLAIFLALMLPLSAAITERYVSSSGTDTYANSTSSSTPMSLTTAYANAVANDRINIKADGTYAFTTAQTLAQAGPIFWRGYTTTIGDGGKATIDGGTSGTYYKLLTVSGANHQFQDLIFAHNGASGTGVEGVRVTGGEVCFIRCVWHDFSGAGVYNSTAIIAHIECEAYACNQSNIAQIGAIDINLSGSLAVRCISHDNVAGANAHGYKADGGMNLYQCISESNTGNGDYSTGDTTSTMIYSEFYNNTLSGVMFVPPSTDMILTMYNCNFVNNSRYGFEFGSSQTCTGTFLNNAFGSGTQANDLGNVEAMEGMWMAGEINYDSDVTPWTDPANGDFRINLAAAKGAGAGSFLQTATSYTGTIGYPDVGAAQYTP